MQCANISCNVPGLLLYFVYARWFYLSFAIFYFQTERQLDYALDLMRRLPPQQIEKNLSDLIDLVWTNDILLEPERIPYIPHIQECAKLKI